jgi:hypothetical protein
VCVVRFFSLSPGEYHFKKFSLTCRLPAFGFYRFFFSFPWSPPCIKMREKEKSFFNVHILFFSRLKNKMNIKEKVELFTKKKKVCCDFPL